MGDDEGVVFSEVVEARACGDQGGDDDSDFEEDSSCGHSGVDGEKEKREDGGGHLGNGFMFTNFFSSENNSFLACDEANAGDEKFAGDNEGNEPDGEESCAKEADKGDGDEKFVGEGIKQATKVGFDFPEASEISVEPIGEGSGDKESEGEPCSPKRDRGMSTSLEKNEKDKGCDNACHGKPIGEGHLCESRLSRGVMERRISGSGWLG